MSPMPPDGWEIVAIPMGVDADGNGPVPDDEADFFICFGCGLMWPCDEAQHHERTKDYFG